MIKQSFILIFVLLLGSQLKAQYKVSIIVTETCPIKRSEVFITGTFNSWDSLGDKRYRLSTDGKGNRSIELLLPAGEYAYKYTGGNWHSVEKSSRGRERDDRKIRVTGDMVVKDTVIHWRDLFIKNVHWGIEHAADDTTKLSLLAELAYAYQFDSDFFNTDSTLYYLEQTLRQLQVIKSSRDLMNWAGYTDWLIYIQELNAVKLHSLGNYPKSLELRLDNLRLAEKANLPNGVFNSIANLIDDYVSMKDYSTALTYSRRLQNELARIKPEEEFYQYAFVVAFGRLTSSYYNLGFLDSALHYGIPLYNFAKARTMLYAIPGTGRLLGDIYAQQKKSDSAFFYYRTARAIASKAYNRPEHFRSLIGMAKLYSYAGKNDSALYYARSALGIVQHDKIELQLGGDDATTFLADVSPLIAGLYKANGQLDSAYKYLELSIAAKDSLFNVSKARDFQNLSFNESLRQLQIEQQNREARQRYETRLKIYGLIAIIAGIMILAFILYRNNKQKQKANGLLASQKSDIEKTLKELRTTQKQLIQSEKMASLGELTAGIAHEIQNPLNFVNNFSEVNSELINELVDEVDKGNTAEVKLIAVDIKENSEKINHHGKRADAIVKGMLQHSQSSSGVKEPTDINALCDEYLRLAYHGLRAKDKSFNATMKTDFDESIGNINIIPQDIGRVVLNLINNAFYAASLPSAGGFLDSDITRNPTVWVSTKKVGDKVLISVRDNGPGIPQKILDKIFQPFFTTKPTGQGTGLGLSLSYDIVKAHGGELKVETKEGEGSTFIIQLPTT